MKHRKTKLQAFAEWLSVNTDRFGVLTGNRFSAFKAGIKFAENRAKSKKAAERKKSKKQVKGVQVGDTVRVLLFKESDINAYARVEKVLPHNDIKVSNMNSPWNGTLAWSFLYHDEYRVVNRKH